MKKIILSTSLLLTALLSHAAEVTPMHIVEKSSYQLGGLVSKLKIDPSYLTDVTTLTVTQDNSGFKVIMQSPSATPDIANKLEIPFDKTGKAGTAVATFTSRYSQGPIFALTNAAVFLDLGAEAIVDHLADSPDNIVVARTTQAVDLQKENSGVLMLVHLTDGRAYSIHMDNKGKVLSQGF